MLQREVAADPSREMTPAVEARQDYDKMNHKTATSRCQREKQPANAWQRYCAHQPFKYLPVGV